MRERYNGLIQSIALCMFTLFCFSGCSKERISLGIIECTMPLFIEMPHAINVFESVENELYTALTNEYKRHGYTLVKQSENAALVLKTTIKRCGISEKLISPDVIPYLLKRELEIECSLVDSKGTVVAAKNFICSHWADRPSNVRLNSHFSRYELQQLMRRSIPRIERSFRTYFLARKKI